MQAKRNPAAALAAVLLSLVLISTYLLSGLYARYAAVGTAEDDGRVAKFSVSESLNSGNAPIRTFSISLLPTEDEPYKIVIDNNSEVAVHYEVTVTNESGNLPLTLTLPSGAGTNAISCSGNLAAGAAAEELALNIAWRSGAQNPTDGYQYNREVELITVRLTCRQID